MNIDDIHYLIDEQKKFSMVHLCKDFDLLTDVQDLDVGLNVYTVGSVNKPLIVLAAPIGSSFLLMAPLAKYLSEKFYVVVSEALVSSYQQQPQADLSLLTSEFSILLRYFNKPAYAIISFCSACNIVLNYLKTSEEIPSQLIVISPLINSGIERNRTLYEEQVMPLWSRIEREGDAFVQMFLHLVKQSSNSENSLDAELESLNRLVLRDSASTKTYARILCSAMLFDSQSVLRDINIPTTIFHAEDDTMVHWQESTLLARISDNISADICKEGGHFFLFKDENFHQKILLRLLEGEKNKPVEAFA